MIQTPLEEIISTVESMPPKSKWHFHMLTPDCVFNQEKEKHAFVLEANSKCLVFYSNEKQLETGQKLVRLLHGNKILEESNAEISQASEGNFLTDKAKECNEKKIIWHHHMLFPECSFNKDKGKWKIVLEVDGEKKVFEANYPAEPSSDLRVIELLLYKKNLQSLK